MKCPRCQTTNRKLAQFCHHCGLWLGENCPNCESDLIDVSIFCDQCGYQVTPLAASGPQWIFQTAHQQPQSQILMPLPVDNDLPAPSSEPIKLGEQPNSSSLQKYIPREMMTKLETARASGTMAGERRVVTMLFCDVKGSTAAAERLDPEEWTEIINGAFEHMIKPIYSYEGTVARLMGDAILAFFGAPITHEDDPQRAVLAGLDILTGISPYLEQIKQKWGIEINVRVGINTGLVVVGAVGSDLRMEYTAMGDAINLAARMEQTAEPGTMQIAYDTYKAVKPFFNFEALGGIEVKGKEEPVLSYRVLGRKPVVGRQRGIEGLKVAMVGRDLELNTLNEILSTVQQGVGHIVSVIGAAGLGKSRLINEAKRSLADSSVIDWFETASLSYETTQPYGLFQRLIRRLNEISPSDPADLIREKLGSRMENLDEQDQRRVTRVFEALFNLAPSQDQVPLEGEAFKREFFQIIPLLWQQRFGQHPSVLVVDDIHWSDPASIELLLQLLSLTAKVPLVLICSFRPDRSGPVWQLRTTADDTYHHRYTEIILRPLSAEQVNELVDKLLSVADLPDALRERIEERAAGNPFFVEEVVRSLIDSGAVISEERTENGQTQLYWRATGDGSQIEIPDNLQSLLAARIDRLEEETRQILQLASVIGRSFYPRVLMAIGNQDNGAGEIERELGHLLNLEMIREVARMPEMEYKFSNPLTQEVAYQTILLKRRREFHRLVGETTETLFAEQLSELAPRLAYHFREAGEFTRGFRYFAMAGEAAFRLYANTEAVAHYDQALALLPQVDVESDLLREIYTNRGRALELIADYPAAVKNYALMEREGERRNDDRLRLGALIAKTIVHSTFTPVLDLELGLPLAEKALDLADRLDEHAAKVEVLWSLMLVHAYIMDDSELSINYGKQALESARTWKLEARLPYILNDLGRIIGINGQVNDGMALMAEARPLFEARNNLPLLADNSNGYSLLLLFAGKLDEALNYAYDAVELSRSLGSAKGVRDSTARVNNILMEQGELGRAIAEMENQLIQLADVDDVVFFGLPILALGYVALGSTSTILERYAAEQHRAGSFGPLFHDYFLAPLAFLYALEGQHELAAEVLAQCEYDPQKDPFAPFNVWIFLAEARLLSARGQYAQAVSLLNCAIAGQSERGLNYFSGDLLLQQAQILQAMDPPQQDEARNVLLQAIKLQEEAGSHRVLWRILAALAELVSEKEALLLRQQAWQIVSRIADGVEESGLRQAFLKDPDVEKVMPAADS